MLPVHDTESTAAECSRARSEPRHHASKPSLYLHTVNNLPALGSHNMSTLSNIYAHLLGVCILGSVLTDTFANQIQVLTGTISLAFTCLRGLSSCKQDTCLITPSLHCHKLCIEQQLSNCCMSCTQMSLVGVSS